MKKRKIWPFVFLAVSLFNGLWIGVSLGLSLAVTVNTKNTENFTDFETVLPTKILDINDELITEFSSDEKREIISLDQLPQHMIDALLTREDRIFYEHHGFSAKALFRAVMGVITRNSLGGGSTLTQQIAGTLYCDRRDYSVKRKLKELWWAIQMERRYSKNEIMELYLNKIYFGGGTYGVNAASKYYFGHPATEITPAEAAILVIQLSNPVYYNPFEHPNRAMERQQTVLNGMVESNYITREQAEESFDAYWAGFDFTRTNTSAYDMREDNAPWFSEYVRRELSGMLYGSDDIYTSGYTVNTTLNLAHQREAEEIMKDYLAYANREYQKTRSSREREAFRKYTPFSELLMLTFNLPDLRVNDKRMEVQVTTSYRRELNPLLDVLSIINGMENLKTSFVSKGNERIKENRERTTIEGTMIALENSTGYIDALVGGSKYDTHNNQFIRAVQARLQPGSTFKPLYYSAGIDSRKFAWSTIISDTPIVFHKEDGSPYIPQDFKGEWEGDVELWYALAHSMNVPSLKVLDEIGFDAAIKRTSALLGIPESELAERGFQPVYPLGLGVCAVRPVEMAKAFSTIANNGKEVVPIAIRNVEDRSGQIIINPEQETRMAQAAKGAKAQIISHETAFIMQEMLRMTVRSGTLAYGSKYDSTQYTIKKDKGTGYKFKYYDKNGNMFYMPIAGKTGTTQNWADAWTVGFTPYYTAAFWFGFDRRGQSLGLSITGSTLAGVAWGDYMAKVHEGKPMKNFNEELPDGIVQMDVCTRSGGIYTPECGENHRITGYFLAGTQPVNECTYHNNNVITDIAIDRIKDARTRSGYKFELEDTSPLSFDLSFLKSNKPSSDYTDDEDADSDLDIFAPAQDSEDSMENWLLQ
ncbi:MAG: PBP1A family penicillin-binding protein [Treponema sp.]|nr:PBP1A family penicillin-binding protein [Treponema sp.]